MIATVINPIPSTVVLLIAVAVAARLAARTRVPTWFVVIGAVAVPAGALYALSELAGSEINYYRAVYAAAPYAINKMASGRFDGESIIVTALFDIAPLLVAYFTVRFSRRTFRNTAALATPMFDEARQSSRSIGERE